MTPNIVIVHLLVFFLQSVLIIVETVTLHSE